MSCGTPHRKTVQGLILIKGLTSYFAILGAITASISGIATILLIHVQGYVSFFTFIELIPIVLVICLLSWLIGHYVVSPLHQLHDRLDEYNHGKEPKFLMRSGLAEADQLSSDMQHMLQRAIRQNDDFERQKNRQMHFVGDVAHELRTPLTAIHGDAELMMDPEMPSEVREQFCKTIIKESERLTHLTNDLLSLQHIQEGDRAMDLKRVNLKDIANDAVDALVPVIQKRKANVKVTGEAPDVLGNADRLQEVVSNLVDNATRFIKPGGHVDVELYGLDGNSIIAVKDDGTGFGDIDPNLLFERFYRTDESRARNSGGSGLGLAIVKSVVEAHDGTVHAFNRPEGGACFVISIPSITPQQ